MLNNLLTFLVAILVLAVVIYAVKLILDMVSLPDQLKQVFWLILGLIILIILLMLVTNIFSVGPGWMRN